MPDTNVAPAPAMAPGRQPVKLQNGFIAGPGIADATGAILRSTPSDGDQPAGWELVGSGVLVASNAILTAAHCFEDCPKATDARFFLPGVGSLDFAHGWMTDTEDHCFCEPLSQEDERLARDLALVVLKQSVHAIKPVPLPPRQNRLPFEEGETARVSGFGKSLARPRRVTGLRQYADVSAESSTDSLHRLRVASTVIRYGFLDSGGPMIRHRPRELIGIAAAKRFGRGRVELPSEATRLSDKTPAWLHDRLDDPGAATPETTSRELGCLYCPVGDKQELIKGKAEVLRIGRLEEGEELVVTLNAVVDPDRPVVLEIAPAGVRPELSKKKGRFFDTKSWSRPTEAELFVWIEAKSATQAQVFYTRNRQHRKQNNDLHRRT